MVPHRYGRAAISSSLYHINQAVAAAVLPRARPRCPPAAAVPRAPPLFWCRSWWRRALGPPRRAACVRRAAARAPAGGRRPCRLAARAWFWWGGRARAARDCARCGARCTAGTWLSATTPCGVAALKPLHMEQHGKGIIFFGDMCGEENTSRPANVRAVRLRRTARALQSGRKPLCPKVILLGSLGTHRFANGACCCLLRSRASCRRRSC